MLEERRDDHLTVADVAAYVDRGLAPPVLARLEAHLAACVECREEIVAVARLARRAPARTRWTVLVPLAAAAAALLLYIGSGQRWLEHQEPVLREPVVTTTVAPRPIAPLGSVVALQALRWTSVPHADRYRVTVFDGGGDVVWEAQLADTVAVVPAAIALHARVPYFWKVAARTGWDRWVVSDLTPFTLDSVRRTR